MKHEKFLSFNGKNIVFLNVDGVYWIALKPILDTLNLDADRYIKKTKRDAFFGTCWDTMSVQVQKNGKITRDFGASIVYIDNAGI